MQQTSRHLQKSTDGEGESSAYTATPTSESDKATPSQEGNHAPAPAFFEITPDIIDQLAAGAAKDAPKRVEQPLEPLKREYRERTPERRTNRRETPDKFSRKPFNREAPTNSYQDDSSAPRKNFRSKILKSNWRPDEEEEEDRKRRWYKRGQQVWTRYAELGLKPPRKWRDEGIGKREKGWKSKDKEERDKERETMSTTWNPRLTRKPEGDGFV
ncbi:hypothetical protein VE04_05314 [Pseudogymnoascus sp. 24MN13]|nr:hypothetical protein VE04_05314 [Pseudogymnoascus sp. 24MN13]